MGDLKKPSLKSNLLHILSILPLGIPLSLSGVGVVAMAFLLLESFNPTVVLAIGIPFALALFYILYRLHPRLKLKKEDIAVLIVILVGVVSWVGINSFLSSQHVHVNRDPAIYSVAGLHLINSESVLIDKSGLLDGVEGITEKSPGFTPSEKRPDKIYAQSSHLLPSFLALGGSVGGNSFLLHLNPIFGGIAIFAVFGLARLIMRSRWALVASMAFSVSLPLIYFSRDTYTEPLLAGLVFGALAMMATAYKYKKVMFWAFAGLLAGAAMLTRADAALSVIGLVVGAGLLMILANKGERKYALEGALSFFSVFGALSFAAWYDLFYFSTKYYNDLGGKITALYALLVVTSAALILLTIISWKTNLFVWLHERTKRWRVKVAVISFIAGSVFLAFRPLWLENERSGLINHLTEGLQALYGMDVNGYRDYAEITINWMVWYIGPVLVVLSVAGFAFAIHKALTSRNIIWVISLASILAVSILYFVRPSITPDQIWAARRFLPVTLPGIAIFGALGLQMLNDWKRKKIFGLQTRSVAIVLAVLAITFPLTVSYPFLPIRTWSTQLTQIDRTCDAVPKNAAIVWYGTAGRHLLRPIDAVCNIDNFRATHSMYDKDSMKEAYKIADSAGKKLYVGVYANQMALIPDIMREEFVSVSSEDFYTYKQTLDRPPTGVNKSNRHILIGAVGSDGAIRSEDN